MADIENLAHDLEEPRAVRLLAEWLAIDHNETRLQAEKYLNDAQELYEYIVHVIKIQKSLGYVKWDREKVMRAFYDVLGGYQLTAYDKADSLLACLKEKE